MHSILTKIIPKIIPKSCISNTLCLSPYHIRNRIFFGACLTAPFAIVKGTRESDQVLKHISRDAEQYKIIYHTAAPVTYIVAQYILMCSCTVTYSALFPIALPFTLYGIYEGTLTGKNFKEFFITL